MDKPSQNLLESLCPFLSLNNQKPIVFVTTGTVDRTPIENFIEFFIKRNYAVITTCDCMINEVYKQEVFYSKFLPLNYICSISSLVVHHCGSGMYHYPIMHGVPTLTIGTQCYDREDIALRLQELGVSGHIPHPEDNSNYWRIFIEFVEKFENNKLVNFKSIEKLKSEIEQTMSGFKMEKVIEYALS
jgi:UDP:flavonoid glycosyltransferase YjiC (YdhE family)